MASPTLSSPSPAPRNAIKAMKKAKSKTLTIVPQPSKHRPQASSHWLFEPRTVQPLAAKTDKVGFLHLPDEVREEIYELAIFDHDRSAVFLPRNQPRKVEPGVDDLEVMCIHPSCIERGWKPGFDPNRWDPVYVQRCHIVSDSEEQWTAAAGQWVGPECLKVEETLELDMPYKELIKLTDEQLLHLLESMDGDESDDNAPTRTPSRGCHETGFPDIDSDLAPENDEDEDGTQDEDEPDDENNDGQEDQDDVSDDDTRSRCESHCGFCGKLKFDAEPANALHDADVESSVEPCSCFDCDCNVETLTGSPAASVSEEPNTCTCGPCPDQECRRCIEHPDHFNVKESDKNAVTTQEYQELGGPADDEHFDTLEEIGVLYEPKEPAILHVSKEIRAQCLPVYYSQNAFSWRFLWTDYPRSCARFKAWTRSILPESVKLITKVTFQGRHAIEEGLEFSIDIDLTENWLFFETNVYTACEDEAGAIAEAINRHTAHILWRIAQSLNSRPILSADLLCELASIFVQGMHRDGGNCVSEEADELRLALSSFF